MMIDAANNAKVRVRMYRQGLGDCFLLTFNPDGTDPKHMLIDCGSIGKGSTGKDMKDIILDIHRETGGTINKQVITKKGHIDILVVTHEHKDHVSGFNVTGKESKLFEECFTVDKVWMAWTEDSGSMTNTQSTEVQALLKKINTAKRDWWDAAKTVMPKFLDGIKQKADKDLDDALKKAENDAEKEKATKTWYKNLQNSYGIADLLNVGDFEEISKSIDGAMDFAKNKGTPTFHKPGDVIEDEKLIPGWRFYVLGPPQDIKQLRETGENNKKSLYNFAESQIGDLTAVIKFFCSDMSLDKYREELKTQPEERQKFNACFPFDDRFRKEIGDLNGSKPVNDDTYKRYFEDSVWRHIDYDWLVGPAESFALQMDNCTNNTSLVLAMEHNESGEVLLFPGDAQLGNWQTWDGTLAPVEFPVIRDDRKAILPEKKFNEIQKDVKEKGYPSPLLNSVDLLNRTVFYKVGHHSSHNATTTTGLDAMNTIPNKSLVAMISLDSSVAYKQPPQGWEMPAPGLYKALLAKTGGHVLRSDMGWPHTIDQTPEFPLSEEDEKVEGQKTLIVNLNNWANNKDTNKKQIAEFVEKLRALNQNKNTTDTDETNLISNYSADLFGDKTAPSPWMFKQASSWLAWYEKWGKWKKDGTIGEEIMKKFKYELLKDDGTIKLILEEPKKLVYLDSKGKFRIEYEIDEKPTKGKIPEPCGNYIDYIMY